MKSYLHLVALTSLLVTLPSLARAADYHHVHLAAPKRRRSGPVVNDEHGLHGDESP